MADTELWNRAQEIFDRTANLSPDERAALLAEACGEDAALRAEVESLLKFEQQAPEGFMKPPTPPAVDGGGDSAPWTARPIGDGLDPLIGKRIGDCTIKSVIAAGGMGMVYEAEQDQPRRTVAIKIMNRMTPSRAALRRFQFESQILAHLRHPNIAQVYEAGMHGISGVRVPYFVMEYVPDARTLTRHAQESELSTRERLQLFAKVCDAVHHGHQKGIIHRDLKPANILVDAAGEPKVIDFGVARTTDADIALTTAQTDAGQLIGTLQYMSPEQCDADSNEIDTRSDVYSLGVVLYELLTGSLPYDVSDTTIVRAARIICESPPAKPSNVDRRVRGDVEMVVLKALHKNRERRYQSAAELAADIRRYLNREPIEARPATAWTRGMRWAVRHPIWVTATACGLVVAITFATTSLGYWVLYQRPDRMILDRQPEFADLARGREARLVSKAGVTIESWASEVERGVVIAELRERPDALGGGRVGVLGFQLNSGQSRAGVLYAIDVDGDLYSPLWERRVATDDIPGTIRENRGFVGDEFCIEYAEVLDIFPEERIPECPGEEIVVTFCHNYFSLRVLRIYNLAGELLYQFWHDGAISSWYWMEDARLLVVAGDSQEPFFHNDGTAKEGANRIRARVVFAVRPRPGYISKETLPLSPGGDPNNPLSPVWFQSLYPEDVSDSALAVRVMPPYPPYDPGRAVRILVTFDRLRTLRLNWILDEHGKVISAEPRLSEKYKFNLKLAPNDPRKKNVPDPSVLYFTPFQPPP